MICAALLALGTVSVTLPDAPKLPKPFPRQLAWHGLETYAFAHFGPNTFTGVEWGHGTEDPKIFNPKNLDCRQWAHTLKINGFKGIMITAKHHDGFCLWPSKFSTHTVAQSRWKEGKGDVLRELSEACHSEGIKFGVYLSPWDRNHPSYGTPAYNQVFANMLQEVLSDYGPVFEVWFDGANGEGPNGKKQVYDWPLFIRTVRKYQPHAVIFSDAGPDIRWVGNEEGYAGETNWDTLHREQFRPGDPKYAMLTEGQEDGADWLPSECDVSIRPGWFWKESENAKVKSVADLMDIYYKSVGRGSSMLLNVPPNSDGVIDPVDVQRLSDFHLALVSEFSHPVAVSHVAASATRGPRFVASRVLDGLPNTYWAAPDGAISPSITLDFASDQSFNRILLQEPIKFGQRVRSFEIQVEKEGVWSSIAKGTTIGHKRILALPVTHANRVRVVITDSKQYAWLSEVHFYLTQRAN